MSGGQPITIEAISCLCLHTDHQFEAIFDIITEVDSLYLQAVREITDANSK